MRSISIRVSAGAGELGVGRARGSSPHQRAGWPQGIAPPGLPRIRTCPLRHTALHIMNSLRGDTLSESAIRLVPDTAIRCCFVGTVKGFDAPAMFPSNGVMTWRPLFSTGSLGMVPPLPRYYGTLRLPAVLLDALVAVHRCSSSCFAKPSRASTDTSGRPLVFQATVPGLCPVRAA